MINSYNAKIKAQLSDTPFELFEWIVSDDTTTGIVDVIVKDKELQERPGTVTRYDLQSLIPATEGQFAVIDTDEIFEAIEQNYDGGIDEVFELLHNATSLNRTEVIVRDEEIERTLVGLWVTKQLYIPITDVILNYLGEDAYVLNYCQTTGKRLYESYEIVAKSNSIGYIGSAKVIVAAKEEVEVPPPQPGQREVEWTVVDWLVDENAEVLSDGSRFSQVKMTGNIYSDKPGMDVTGGSPVSYVSTAYYTMLEGDHVRLEMDVPKDTETPVILFPKTVKNTAWYNETNAMHYPYVSFEASDESYYEGLDHVDMSVKIGNSILTIYHKDAEGGKVQTSFDYTPTLGDLLNIDYKKQNGEIHMNIAGLTTIVLPDVNSTIAVVLAGGVHLDLGGVSNFTSNYVTTDLVKPDWINTFTIDERPIEELPQTVFTTRSDTVGDVGELYINMDINKTDKWSLRDSSGLELFGSSTDNSGVPYLINGDLSDLKYHNVRLTIPAGTLVPGETYTLFGTARSFKFYSNNESTDGIDFITMPHTLNRLQFALRNREFTVPNNLPSILTNMSNLFYEGFKFNQDISSWNMSAVTNISGMFGYCELFNYDISGWDVSNVTNMNSIFAHTELFNQNINGWNTSKVTDMSQVFRYAKAFNQPLNNWDTSNVVTIQGMFWETTAFNQDISGWNTSKVTDMSSMFDGAKAFDLPIGIWNTGNVSNMSQMFANRSVFNQDISTWNISNVSSMNRMFAYSNVFNQDISGWDVSSLTEAIGMFNRATVFNQDLSQWCVSKITTAPQEFDVAATAWTLPKPVWGTCPA